MSQAEGGKDAGSGHSTQVNTGSTQATTHRPGMLARLGTGTQELPTSAASVSSFLSSAVLSAAGPSRATSAPHDSSAATTCGRDGQACMLCAEAAMGTARSSGPKASMTEQMTIRIMAGWLTG